MRAISIGRAAEFLSSAPGPATVARCPFAAVGREHERKRGRPDPDGVLRMWCVRRQRGTWPRCSRPFAKAPFDRELGAFRGALGTHEERIRWHLFGPGPVAFALFAGAGGAGSRCTISVTRHSLGAPEHLAGRPVRLPGRPAARGRPPADGSTRRGGGGGRLHPHCLGREREQRGRCGVLSAPGGRHRPPRWGLRDASDRTGRVA